ncbi:PREDICTED: uncharacterized protein LOC104816065 [Tarenaya hassleriana]|uniref:uncharacterized protein LOC104816065 n=1 Tax=Tarenaya hassleriana TaxID=28532 RepID=UPI00053C63E2|nr:PREDICTED: uncharacterized protein LOC104816065 [Tarenaya hassleriana]
MRMEIRAATLLLDLVVAAYVVMGLASPSTVPGFLWSPHLQPAIGELDEAVNYQVMSAKDLVNSVLTQGGWSNFLCSEKKLQRPVDLALVFIGKELLSSEMKIRGCFFFAQNLFTASNFSLAFPYIAAPEEERMESLFLSGLKEACADSLGVSNVVFSESCFVEDGRIQKLADLQSFKDHLLARREMRKEGETDLVVLCSEGSELSGSLDQSRSEGETISELVSSMEQSGTKYAALYVSDPYWYTSYQTLQRFLAESAAGNSSLNVTTTCDEVCKFKSSLLEGVLVGIVLLLILISGLCCMAGIDTPSRFETPQES